MWVHGLPQKVIMRDREPTMRSREIGAGLHRARLTGKQVAHQLDWSPSWVSRPRPGRPLSRLARPAQHPHPLTSPAQVPRRYDSLRLSDWRLIGAFTP